MKIRKFLSLLGVVALMVVALSSVAAAAHGDGGGGGAPAPVEVDSICRQRHGLDTGWKVGGECTSYGAVTIVFNGSDVDGYFVGGSSPSNPLRIIGVDSSGYPSNADPVTLTGDGSVAACLTKYGVIHAPYSPSCVTPIVI